MKTEALEANFAQARRLRRALEAECREAGVERAATILAGRGERGELGLARRLPRSEPPAARIGRRPGIGDVIRAMAPGEHQQGGDKREAGEEIIAHRAIMLMRRRQVHIGAMRAQPGSNSRSFEGMRS